MCKEDISATFAARGNPGGHESEWESIVSTTKRVEKIATELRKCLYRCAEIWVRIIDLADSRCYAARDDLAQSVTALSWGRNVVGFGDERNEGPVTEKSLQHVAEFGFRQLLQAVML